MLPVRDELALVRVAGERRRWRSENMEGWTVVEKVAGVGDLLMEKSDDTGDLLMENVTTWKPNRSRR